LPFRAISFHISIYVATPLLLIFVTRIEFSFAIISASSLTAAFRPPLLISQTLAFNSDNSASRFGRHFSRRSHVFSCCFHYASRRFHGPLATPISL